MNRFLILCFLVIFASVGELHASSAKTIVVTGSSSVAPLLTDIGARFEMIHPRIRVDVQTGGSSRGLADARTGLADIGMVSRSPKKGESVAYHWFAVAHDSVGIILHRQNSVSQLSDAQIHDIYLGKINNWAEVGGADREITVVSKADGRSTLEVFLKHFGLRSYQIDADVIIGDNQQAIVVVTGNPDAIAYVSVGAAQAAIIDRKPIQMVRATQSPGSKSKLAALTSIRRTLHVVTSKQPKGAVKQFIDFAQSESVHDLVSRHYLEPIKP